MEQTGQNIVSVEHLKIDFFPAAEYTQRLLFTFTEFTNRKLDGTGFGGAFASKNEFDHVAIKTDSDDWYKSFPSEAFEKIEQFLANLHKSYITRATYGSSMGAYAAILFARDLRADVAFALSPQFDIAPSWEERWAARAKEIGSIRTFGERELSPKCDYFVAFDPANPDRLHFEEFAKVIPRERLHAIKVPYGGHPVGYFLNASESLADLARTILAGTRPPNCRNKTRSKRRTYPDYLFNLAGACLKRDKIAWAKSLILDAINQAPLNPEYRIRAAIISEAMGDLDDAVSHAAIAVAISPSHPLMVSRLSLILHRKGLNKPALHFANAALAILPNSKDLIDIRDNIRRAVGV